MYPVKNPDGLMSFFYGVHAVPIDKANDIVGEIMFDLLYASLYYNVQMMLVSV